MAVTVRIVPVPEPVKVTIKPKTPLIVALSAVVSLFVGIFLVFVIEFIKNARSRLQENEEGLSPA